MYGNVYNFDGRQFINYAHRGASEYAPENTMSAFKLGLKQGANGIETDVRMSRDGVLVLFHDDDVARVTTSAGPIGAMTYEQMQELDIVKKGVDMAADKIVTLWEFLDFAAGTNANLAIEIKQEGVEGAVLAMLSGYDLKARTVITSFHFSSIKNVAVGSDYRVGYLVRDINPEVIEQLHSIKGYQMCLNIKDVTPDIVRMLKGEGFSVRAWGIKTEDEMRRAFDAGVDGMTVNFPDKLRDLVSAKL